MSAPTLDKPSARPASTSNRPRRRPMFLLVASALVVLATAIGASVAIANRPLDRRTPAEQGAAAGDPALVQSNSPTPEPAATPQPAAKAAPTADPGSGTPVAKAPVLADGQHQAYISKVGDDSIVVDVVQVFTDGAAVEAAIQDGTPRDQARYLTTHVRNQNPRLRTLPLAGDLRIMLRDACGDPGNDRDALLTKLAGNARLGVYYYTLTVSDGAVQRIQERLAINAC